MFQPITRLFHSTFSSPFGPITLVASDAALVRLEFGTSVPRIAGTEIIANSEKTSVYERQLNEYLAGKRRYFDLRLDLRGTEFQRLCWQALFRIPYGETRSYAELARMVGRPRACRAVGAANGSNPIAIIVPCHRVIASDGTLGGYGGGLPAKRWLLELEQRHTPGRGTQSALAFR